MWKFTWNLHSTLFQIKLYWWLKLIILQAHVLLEMEHPACPINLLFLNMHFSPSISCVRASPATGVIHILCINTIVCGLRRSFPSQASHTGYILWCVLHEKVSLAGETFYLVLLVSFILMNMYWSIQCHISRAGHERWVFLKSKRIVELVWV